ncbi:MAG: hypothetical protein ACTSP4_14425, partial [Candidatus Hodarchaeales archaeon]
TSFEPSTLNLDANGVLDIVLADDSIAGYVAANPDYYTDIGLNVYYGDDSWTTWYVSFWTFSDTGNYIETTPSDPSIGYISSGYSYAFASVDDETGEILYVEAYVWEEATLTEADVLTIASSVPEVQTFITDFPDAEGYAYYDYFGTWWVYYSHPYIWEAWVSLYVDDSTGEVHDVDVSQPNIIPALSYQDVIDLVNATPEVINFTSYFPNASYYAYYDSYSDEACWYVEISSSSSVWFGDENGDGFPDDNETYESWFFTIADSTGEILDMYYYNFGGWYWEDNGDL